ncbi:MAG TPA: lysozyme inhibitor LprI family protein, partial [Paracoccaceae bacterium]|nr:lysozyme inhibitor LprI family protein [Paracoccaceae bacterium]
GLLSAALLYGIWGGTGSAQTAEDCADPVQQQTMNACAMLEYQKADADLNAAWKPARAFADEIGVAEDLLAAQRAWLAYRDAACKAQSSPYEGGSLRPLVHATCLTDLTVARTQMLLEFHGY